MNKNKPPVENRRKRLLSLPLLADNPQIRPKSPSNTYSSANIFTTFKDIQCSISNLSNSDDNLTLLKKSKSDNDYPISSDFQSQVVVQNAQDWEPRRGRKVTFSLIDENLPRRLSNEIELKPELKPEWLRSKIVLKVLYLMYSDKSNPLDELPPKTLFDEELQNREAKMQELRRAVERMRYDLSKNCTPCESHSGSVTPRELLQSIPDFIKRQNKTTSNLTHLSVSQQTPQSQPISPPIQNQESNDIEDSSSSTSKRPKPKFTMTAMEKNMLAPISF